MNRLEKRILIESVSIFIFLILGLTSCTDPIISNQLRYGDMTGEIADGYNPNKIRVRCGRGCQTLSFQKKLIPIDSKATAAQKKYEILVQKQRNLIRQFLRHQPRNKLVYIAPCDTWPIQTRVNKALTKWVAEEVSRAGYSPWITRPVIPLNENTPTLCVSLLRGRLALIPPSCPNLRIKDSVYRQSSDFGCSSNRTLATMILNPWDLLAPPGISATVGAARVAQGNMNYNNGVTSKLMEQRPYRTNADYN